MANNLFYITTRLAVLSLFMYVMSLELFQHVSLHLPESFYGSIPFSR